MPNLHTIRNVELAKVGVWQISTGTWTVTPADLAAAVAAHRAGVLRRPVIKIGHDSAVGDGAPALGRLDNLRVTDGGNTLVGDMVDVPRAVAALLPHAYPSRSLECAIDYTDPDGRVWPLVVEAVALLGAAAPGVSTLREVADVYDVAAAGRRIRVAATTFSTATDLATRARAVAVARARRTRTARTERTPIP